jgi:hypothetical protein
MPHQAHDSLHVQLSLIILLLPLFNNLIMLLSRYYAFVLGWLRNSGVEGSSVEASIFLKLAILGWMLSL